MNFCWLGLYVDLDILNCDWRNADQTTNDTTLHRLKDSALYSDVIERNDYDASVMSAVLRWKTQDGNGSLKTNDK